MPAADKVPAFPDAFSAFVEAARKGRLRVSFGTHGEYREIRLPQDWLTVPVFAFADPVVVERVHAMQGGQITLDQAPPLPHPECVFMLNTGTTDPEFPDIVEQVLLFLQADETDGSWTCFEAWRDVDPVTGRTSPWYLITSGWRYSFAMQALAVVRLEMPGLPEKDDPQTPEEREQDLRAYKEQVLYCIALATALADSGRGDGEVEVRDAPETQAWREMNRGRERGRLRPLSSIRVLSLSQLGAERSRQRGAPTGATVAPHWRRAHTRTLQDGRQIPVRATAIHGGGHSPPMTIVRP